MSSSSSHFLAENVEDGDFNQYWYSKYTIEKITEELVDLSGKQSDIRIAFISTPSLYFSLPEGIRKNCHVLDYDRKFGTDPNFVFYDFREPKKLGSLLSHSFDAVVIDPPFITSDCWENYAISAKILLKPGGRVLLTTVAENESMIFNLLGAKPNVFQPSIPNLVYQYSLFTNYESTAFSVRNPEIPE